jgi:inositol oxygenase
MSWGHDEYIYRVVKDYLPEPALYMLRYRSFYAAHRHRAYRHLMSSHGEDMFSWVQKFNPYDLYSKGAAQPQVNEMCPYYEDLIAEFFPDSIHW